MPSRFMKGLALVEGLLFASAVLYWLAFKSGRITPNPTAFAVLISALLLAMTAHGAVVLRDVLRGRRAWMRGAAQLAVIGGLIAAGAGGLANWALHLQGFVILSELETVPLFVTSHLQAFDAGPLSRVEEMHLTVQVEKVSLLSGVDGRYFPESQLRVARDEEPIARAVISPSKAAAVGTLRFHQGAFGFSPRVVIVKDGKAVFDRDVPFTTRREGPGIFSYEGDFEVEAERLRVGGHVDVTTLDERMKGHAKLGLTLSRGDEVLGEGELLPGHFADLAGGYRVGFAGLKKWTELDFSRKTYPAPMLAGAIVAALGALAWLASVIAARRKR